ncbi:MAG: hypothetical protein Q9166_003519 [cf. Caloplaca sp. 2 TL-2023]
MEMQFRHLERSIQSQPMPPEFQDTKAWIYCNDCNAKSSVKYHWLGLKCGVCDSYNTAQLQIIRSADQGSIPNGSAETPPSPHLRGRAIDATAQIQRATNSAPPSAVISPIHDEDHRVLDFQGRDRSSSRRHRIVQDESTNGDGRESLDEDDTELSDDDDWNSPGDEADDDEKDQMEIFGHR